MRHILKVSLAIAIPTLAGAQQHTVDPTKLGDEAVQRTQEYLRINTSNPPGNEDQTMKFFVRIFAAEGIPFDTASSAPGRGNIWARLKGSGNQPALVLLHHMDVVPADPHYWSVDPFSGVIKDGLIWGRGALDTKTLGIMELESFLALKRSGQPLDRDVIFLATADEEAGAAFGAGWVVKNHPEAFKGAGMLINEGGDGTLVEGRRQFAVEVTQKTPLWLKLTVVGRPGHGSTPPPASAVNRLIRALDRLQTYEFAPRVVPAVRDYMAAVSASVPERWRAAFKDPLLLVNDRNALAELQVDMPEFAALLRNTCSITMLQGSNKVNVIPPEASAQLDCRLLPDENHEAFVRELTAVLNDPSIKVDKILDFTPAVSSTETPLYQTITRVLHAHYPDASIAPAVSTGFTDSHFFRDLGIASYGFSPAVIPESDESGVHGNNERISVENVRTGTAIMLELVRALVSPSA